MAACDCQACLHTYLRLDDGAAPKLRPDSPEFVRKARMLLQARSAASVSGTPQLDYPFPKYFSTTVAQASTKSCSA